MDTFSVPLAPGQRAMVVDGLTRATADVVVLQLRPADGQAFPYRAGQFIALHLPGGLSRCYSMATRPVAGAPLVFHIRLHPRGVFSGWLQAALSQPLPALPTLTVSGPYGSCTRTVEAAAGRHTVLLATGTGIAPLAALVDEALADGDDRPLSLYWGARQPDDFYCRQTFEALAARHPHFRFIPVVEGAAPGWRGRRGWVQDCAADDFPDLAAARVYACGAPAMVQSARQTLMARCGLSGEHFYADAFETSPAAATETPSALWVRAHLRLPDGQQQSLTLTAGSSLMASLRELGLIKGVCGGHRSCGSCRVEVDPAWQARLPAADRAEARLLAVLDTPVAADRLACQIVVTPELEGLTLAIPDKPL